MVDYSHESKSDNAALYVFVSIWFIKLKTSTNTNWCVGITQMYVFNLIWYTLHQVVSGLYMVIIILLVGSLVSHPPKPKLIVIVIRQIVLLNFLNLYQLRWNHCVAANLLAKTLCAALIGISKWDFQVFKNSIWMFAAVHGNFFSEILRYMWK